MAEVAEEVLDEVRDSVGGSCVCGAVRYTLTAPFGMFNYCHCSRCRKRSGSAFATNLFVEAERFSFTEGEEHIHRFELEDAKAWSNAFCDVCGSGVPWLTRSGGMMVIPAGSLDGDPGCKPGQNIQWASRASWYVHPHELDTYETYRLRGK